MSKMFYGERDKFYFVSKVSYVNKTYRLWPEKIRILFPGLKNLSKLTSSDNLFDNYL